MVDFDDGNLSDEIVHFCNMWNMENDNRLSIVNNKIIYDEIEYKKRKFTSNEKNNIIEYSLYVNCDSKKCPKYYTFYYPSNTVRSCGSHNVGCSRQRINKVSNIENTNLELNSDNVKNDVFLIENSNFEIKCDKVQNNDIKTITNEIILTETTYELMQSDDTVKSIENLFENNFFIAIYGYGTEFKEYNITCLKDMLRFKKTNIFYITKNNEMMSAMLYRKFKGFFLIDYIVSIPKSGFGIKLINNLKGKLNTKTKFIYLHALKNKDYDVTDYYIKQGFTEVKGDEKARINKLIGTHSTDEHLPLLKF